MGALFSKTNELKDTLIKNLVLTAEEWSALQAKAEKLNASLEETLIKDGYLKQRDLMDLYINRFKRKPLARIILDHGWLDSSHHSTLLKKFKNDEKGLLAELIRENILTHEQAARILAEKYELPYADLTDFQFDVGQFPEISLEIMESFNFIPLKKLDEGYLLVIDDPADVVKIDNIKTLLGEVVHLRVGSSARIREIIEKNRGARGVLTEIAEDFQLQIIREEGEGEEEKIVSVDELDESQSPMIKLVNSIIFQAIERRVSDIHIESAEDRVVVKYRIDGVLYKAMDNLSKRFHDTIISRLKIMAELNIAEKRIPQDGRFKIRYRQRTIDFRVSVMPSIFGEDAVIRILDKIAVNLDLKSLGFSATDLARFARNIRKPYGMVLVTGPTGSGKTTTLYSAIRMIHTGEDKIITIEDPIEYQLPGVTQIPVNEKKGLTFARGLRSILRHDPDKIMVGEIRDGETAQIAIQSALTGHLVFSTIHANNVLDVIGRLINMGIEPYNFVSSLACILAQRLVRQICDNCKVPVMIPADILAESGIDPDKYKSHVFYEGKGCVKCSDTGYHGRIGIFELIDLSDQIKEMILSKSSFIAIKKLAQEENMTNLRQSAIQKVIDGVTTLHEINRVTFVE